MRESDPFKSYTLIEPDFVSEFIDRDELLMQLLKIMKQKIPLLLDLDNSFEVRIISVKRSLNIEEYPALGIHAKTENQLDAFLNIFDIEAKINEYVEGNRAQIMYSINQGE